MKRLLTSFALLLALSSLGNILNAKDKKKDAAPVLSPLDKYVAESEARRSEAFATTPGSIWIAGCSRPGTAPSPCSPDQGWAAERS